MRSLDRGFEAGALEHRHVLRGPDRVGEGVGGAAGLVLDVADHLLTFRHHIRAAGGEERRRALQGVDRKSTRLNSSHRCISYAVFCLKKKTIGRTRMNV